MEWKVELVNDECRCSRFRRMITMVIFSCWIIWRTCWGWSHQCLLRVSELMLMTSIRDGTSFWLAQLTERCAIYSSFLYPIFRVHLSISHANTMILSCCDAPLGPDTRFRNRQHKFDARFQCQFFVRMPDFQKALTAFGSADFWSRFLERALSGALKIVLDKADWSVESSIETITCLLSVQQHLTYLFSSCDV